MSTTSTQAKPVESVAHVEESVFQSVRALLASRFKVPLDDVRPESELVFDLGIDWIDAEDLPLVLEEAFEIDIANSDAQGISTVEDAVKCVLRCRAQS
jgi:acyl carrier protein